MSNHKIYGKSIQFQVRILQSDYDVMTQHVEHRRITGAQVPQVTRATIVREALKLHLDTVIARNDVGV